jgi:hypothetical protein
VNILRILTLNKHGDFEEVLFSSALSYLLNPKQDHGLGTKFLEKVAREVFSDIDLDILKKADVESERTLGNKGNIDLLITFGNKVLAIETKIWDRSANNVSSINEHQVERYCKHLSSEFSNTDWKFVYLIPATTSRTCINEFKKSCHQDLNRHMKLMTWLAGDPINDVQELPEENIISKSISEILPELMLDIKRVDIPLNTLWLIDSLIEIMPELEEATHDPGRFPTKEILSKLPTWPIFEKFLSINNRWPSSIATTVGFPYGRRTERTDFHKNSLYRIRTVTDYYSEASELEMHLPIDRVELELWPDAYEASKLGVLDWLKELGLNQNVIRKDYHLDGGKTETIVVSIDKSIIINEDNVNQLNYILREGFQKLM